MKKMVRSASIVAVSCLLGAVGCAVPQGEEVEARVETEESVTGTTLRVYPRPDFAPTEYAGDNACVLYTANNTIQSWRYRFVLSNKGTADGTVPMVKIQLTKNYNGDVVHTAYLFNVVLPAGTSKVMTIMVPKGYPTAYTATVEADPANTIVELSKGNNVLIDTNLAFTSGLPGDGKCKD